MDFNQIDKKIMQLKNKNEAYHQMVSRFLKKYEQEFSLKYAHESTVIEGNTCSYDEAQKILYGIYRVDPGATDRQREVYEIRNHANTFSFLKDKLLRREPLDEDLIREMHRRLVENIMVGGIYRNENVGIGGSRYDFPEWQEVPFQMLNYAEALKYKSAVCGLPEMSHPLELAAWAHEEFVSIHPFRDGNGRTARMLSNYILMQHGYLPISVPAEKNTVNRYYQILEDYHQSKDIKPLVELFGELEEQELDHVIQIAKENFMQSNKGIEP